MYTHLVNALFSHSYLIPFKKIYFSLLYNSDALISVTTVRLGESVTFTCIFPELEDSNIRIKWYKQSVGDTLSLITSLMKGTSYPTFEEGFHPSRFYVNHTTTSSNLAILSTVQEDEALYHCSVTTWNKDLWEGNYLSFKGNLSDKNCKYKMSFKLLVIQIYFGQLTCIFCFL